MSWQEIIFYCAVIAGQIAIIWILFSKRNF